ncbi:MAG: FKBP-type peptidyl-prolyl cis-trans isomerase [Crocinitomicaceae bacterium]|jgi:FKBP-type peptidyl-prolyl cis-trans isomerase|nr:FKBP-type peptidyl-prolyl cis-trans isomerase [Crocinitomicaceae bacterium]MDP4760870.1 FKBP-type peptidyl-prolyl cis-trans isomerase [Crocinitomicaceae bacterium]
MMKKNLAIAALIFSGSVSAQLSKVDSVSYLVGMNIGTSVMKDFSEANVELLMKGIQDAMMKQTPMCSDPGNAMLNNYFQQKQQMTQMQEEKNAMEYKSVGEEFLASNAKRKGVKVTDSGLQYEVLKEGKGANPTATSTVKVHYHGTTPEGVVFDSSVDRGEPISFGLNQVIKGWTEGVQLMKVGAKYKFYIPQELAYGPSSPSPIIKPYMPLVFEVELLEIEK